MRRAELAALLELKLLPGVGDGRLWRLLERHRSAQAALSAYLNSPRHALGLPAPRREFEAGQSGAHTQISTRERAVMHDRIAHAMDTIETDRIRVLVPRDRAYPRRLSELHSPPPVLFARGDPALLREAAVAVVGSRVNTEYGASTARLLAAGLARAGAVVISGLARGIDRIAHEATLEAGGRTIAVLGCGVDVMYPPEHSALQELIARDGLLISEFLPGEPPQQHNFPKRNRIIAALALGAVVVEAGPKSGALITARHAIDLDRSVFAVPGPIGRETSAGTNELIRDGAFLVTCVADILDVLGGVGSTALGPAPGREHAGAGDRAAGGARARERKSGHLPESGADAVTRAPQAGSATCSVGTNGEADPLQPGGLAQAPTMGVHTIVWSALSEEGAYIDEVAAQSGVTPNEALVALLELELDGRVRQVAGMRFIRT